MKRNTTNPLEVIREEVLQQELSARSWKAYFEKMYYTIEAHKIEEEYGQVQESIRARITENDSKRAELEKIIQEATETAVNA